VAGDGPPAGLSTAVPVKKRVIRWLVGQFHRPHGIGGHLAGWVMAHRCSNRRRNQWVVSLLNVQPADRVLEIGFGPGIAIAELSRLAIRGQAYGVDHSAVIVRHASKRNAAAIRSGRVDLRVGSAEDLPTSASPWTRSWPSTRWGSGQSHRERLKDLRARLKPGGLIAIASQPRCPGATAQTSQRAAQKIEAALTGAGFSQTQPGTAS
jgi:ubiquinone/menaquinone biosynthesis C-methylase UbiE